MMTVLLFSLGFIVIALLGNYWGFTNFDTKDVLLGITVYILIEIYGVLL